jgi:hypothetical protein
MPFPTTRRSSKEMEFGGSGAPSALARKQRLEKKSTWWELSSLALAPLRRSSQREI